MDEQRIDFANSVPVRGALYFSSQVNDPLTAFAGLAGAASGAAGSKGHAQSTFFLLGMPVTVSQSGLRQRPYQLRPRAPDTNPDLANSVLFASSSSSEGDRADEIILPLGASFNVLGREAAVRVTGAGVTGAGVRRGWRGWCSV